MNNEEKARAVLSLMSEWETEVVLDVLMEFVNEEYLAPIYDKLEHEGFFSRTFSVNVIGCNADTFRERYSEYIQSEREGVYDDRVFELEAPQEIYDEIDDLKEECIEILED